MGYRLYISNLPEEPDSSISFGSEVRFAAGKAGKHGAPVTGGFPTSRWNFFYDRRGVWMLWIRAVLQGLFVSFCTLSSLRETQIYSGMSLLILPWSGDSFILQEAEKSGG